MLITTSKFFKDNKITQAYRASAVCGLWKFYNCLLHQIARGIMWLLVHNVHGKTSQKVKTDAEILKACMQYL